MCGFFGYISPENHDLSVNVVHSIQNHLKKRGPDYQGFFHKDQVTLIHTRLAILDLDARSHQPFFSSDGRYGLVYNGEVYNFQDLRAALAKLSYSFKTRSDTEVVLAAYSHYGASCFEKFEGMFSLALHDFKTGETILARDLAGIKPLYYTHTEKGLVFASDLRSLSLSGLINRQLDRHSVRHFLYFGFSDHPRTFFRDIFVLPPGTYYTSKDKNVISYTQLSSRRRGGPLCPPGLGTYSPDDFDAILSASVKHTLVSDVEVGVLLSGGIDSGLIAAEAARLHPGIKAYSLGFPIRSYDETDKAAAIAKILKIPHQVIPFDVDWHKELSDFVIDVSDPLADSSLMATRQLCREVSQHHKAVLSGDGADELFAGYELYRAEFLLNRYGSFFNALRPVLSGLDAMTSVSSEKNSRLNRLKRLSDVRQKNPLSTHLMLRGLWQGFSLAEILAPEQTFKNPEEISFGYTEAWQRWAKADQTHHLATSLGADFDFHLPGDMLTKVDRASMAYGLEVRVPFLNPRLIRYAFSLPDAAKIGGVGVQTKVLLRKKFAAVFGKKLAQQKKSGFSVPLTDFFNTWMKTSWPGFGENIDKLGLLRPDWKKQIETAWVSRKFFLENGLFSLLVLEGWLREYG